MYCNIILEVRGDFKCTGSLIDRLMHWHWCTGKRYLCFKYKRQKYCSPKFHPTWVWLHDHQIMIVPFVSLRWHEKGAQRHMWSTYHSAQDAAIVLTLEHSNDCHSPTLFCPSHWHFLLCEHTTTDRIVRRHWSLLPFKHCRKWNCVGVKKEDARRNLICEFDHNKVGHFKHQ